MTLKMQVKNYYDKNFIYPKCPKSVLLARLMKQKSFTEDNLVLIRELGYNIEWVPDIL